MERAAAEANETMKRRLLELTRVPRVGRLVLLVRGCRAERELFAHQGRVVGVTSEDHAAHVEARGGEQPLTHVAHVARVVGVAGVQARLPAVDTGAHHGGQVRHGRHLRMGLTGVSLGGGLGALSTQSRYCMQCSTHRVPTSVLIHRLPSFHLFTASNHSGTPLN